MTMLEPFLEFDSVEILNSHRLYDYLSRSPVRLVDRLADCGGPGYDTGPYVTPAQDPAPWYNAAVPESGDFLGYTTDVEKAKIGWTGQRGYGDVVSLGSSAGALRRSGLTVTFEDVWLIGRSCEALDYGLQWLQWKLTLPDCPVDAVVYLCPGTAARRRTLCRVSLAEFEETTPVGADRCAMRSVRFVLRAELPYLLGDAEDCLTSQSFAAPDSLVASGGWSGAVMALLPAGFWRQNDSALSTMTDSSGNARHGTHASTPVLSQPSLIASDPVDLSVFYDGLPDGSPEYSTVPDNAAWDQASFGFGIWFNSTTGDAARRRLVERLTTGGAALLWIMTYDPVAGTVEALVNFPSGQVQISGGAVADGETHFAVFTVSRQGGVSTVRLFVDGVQVASGSMGGAQLASSDQGLTFARRSLGTPTNYFGGRLDEAIFFTNDEDPAVIAALYAIATQTSLEAPVDPLCCLVEADQPAADQPVEVVVQAGADPAVVRVVVTDRGDQVCPVGFIPTGTDGAVTFAGATSAVLPALADATVDDVQLAFFQLNHESTVITPPAGWTLVLDDPDSTGATNRLAVYRRRMGTTDTAGSRTFTFSIAVSGQGYVSNYPGVDPDNPIDSSASAEVASGTTHAAPTVTLTGAGKVVAVVALVASSSFTPPNDMVERHDAAEGAARTLGVFDEWRPALGATGTMAATSAGAGSSLVATVALRAAQGTTVSDFTVTVPAGETLTVDAGCREVTSTPALVAGTPTVFAFTGAAQVWIPPAGAVAVLFDVQAAEGGEAGAVVPGLGERVTGTLPLTGGDVEVNVGGLGGNGANPGTSAAAAGGVAGWNGGGVGGAADATSGVSLGGGGGGGASDLREGGSTLADRKVVAGGGGGTPSPNGGDGGGTTGEDGVPASPGSTDGQGGFGGTPSVGGAGGAKAVSGTGGTAGSAGASGVGGAGGAGMANTNSTGGGGGGGGLFGGGGGGGGQGNGGAGAGGSGYTDPTVENPVHTAGFRAGNGTVTLTPLYATEEGTGLAQIDATAGIITWPTVPSGSRYCVCAYQVGAYDAAVTVTIRSRSATAI